MLLGTETLKDNHNMGRVNMNYTPNDCWYLRMISLLSTNMAHDALSFMYWNKHLYHCKMCAGIILGY